MKTDWTEVPKEKLTESIRETHKLFSSNKWLCSDGDSVELDINFDWKSFELQFLSGITGSSVIEIDCVDFGSFNKLIAGERDFETQCFIIAEFFCKLFCQDINSMGKTGLDNLIEFAIPNTAK